MDEHFDNMILDEKLEWISVQYKNHAAFFKNERLRMMLQPINPIKVPKPGDDPKKFVWTSHPQVPKHMKSTYILGQRAKGIFEPRWDGKSDEESKYFISLYGEGEKKIRHSFVLYIVRIVILYCRGWS